MFCKNLLATRSSERYIFNYDYNFEFGPLCVVLPQNIFCTSELFTTFGSDEKHKTATNLSFVDVIGIDLTRWKLYLPANICNVPGSKEAIFTCGVGDDDDDKVEYCE
jgi:hypothetical protein